MNEIASPGQLRMSYIRWALLCVPLVLGLGTLMGLLAGSGYNNHWFAALEQPSIVLPGWVFGTVWTVLYILMGLAAAMIIGARGAAGRGLALTVFTVQLIANYAWSPLFFRMHQVTAALWLILFIFIAAIVTTILFARVRPLAAWLMVPYLCWLGLASGLNYDIDRRNPDAENLAPPAASTNIGDGQGQ